MYLSNQTHSYAPSFGKSSYSRQSTSGNEDSQSNGWQDAGNSNNNSQGASGSSDPSSGGHTKGKHHKHHHRHHHGKHAHQGQSSQSNSGYGGGADPNLALNGENTDPSTQTGYAPNVDTQGQSTDNQAETVTPVALPKDSGYTSTNGVKLGVPSYSYPGDSQGFWDQIQQAKPGSIFIMNPNSGPGNSTDASFKAAVDAAHAKGVKIYGYVSTQYGNRSATDVMNDVQSYKNNYGVDGIFLDEAQLDKSHVGQYGQYSSSIHGSGMEVAFNPGQPDFDPSAVDMADHIMNFEGSYSDYQNAQFPTWIQNAPADKFWNVIYGAPSNVNVQNVLDMAQSKHAGLVYVTDDSGANPYDQAPSFWNSELNLTA